MKVNGNLINMAAAKISKLSSFFKNLILLYIANLKEYTRSLKNLHPIQWYPDQSIKEDLVLG